MNDAQIIAISMTVLAVLAEPALNNLRIGELNTSVNRHLDDMRDVLLAAMDSRTERSDSRFQPTDLAVNQRFERLDSKLDTIISMIRRLDTRIAKLGERSS